MSNLRCVIVDDEELARELLVTYVDKVSYLDCLGSFENPMDALSFVKKNDVDILFLDIQMPDLKGTELAGLINDLPTRIVFTTAYSEYALEGFELNAMDYLVKPITFKRFLASIERVPQKKDSEGSRVIKSGYDLHKVQLEDIVFVKSDSEYVHYHLKDGTTIMANQSLSKLDASLPDFFMRVHRSYLINRKLVSGLKGRELLLGEIKIPVSDSYFETVKNKLFGS